MEPLSLKAESIWGWGPEILKDKVHTMSVDVSVLRYDRNESVFLCFLKQG